MKSDFIQTQIFYCLAATNCVAHFMYNICCTTHYTWRLPESASPAACSVQTAPHEQFTLYQSSHRIKVYVAAGATKLLKTLVLDENAEHYKGIL